MLSAPTFNQGAKPKVGTVFDQVTILPVLQESLADVVLYEFRIFERYELSSAGVACCPNRNMRLSAANSRLIVVFAVSSACRLSTDLANCSLVTSTALMLPKTGFK